MELQSITDTKSKTLLKNYKNGLDQIKKRYLKIKEVQTDSKKSVALDVPGKETKTEKLIENEDLVWNSFNKLEKAKRSAIEMENVSLTINRDLSGQTETMTGINSKVSTMNEHLTDSNWVITKMLRRENRNKFMLVFFSITLITLFLVVFCLKVFNSSGSAAASTSSKNNNSIAPINTNSDNLPVNNSISKPVDNNKSSVPNSSSFDGNANNASTSNSQQNFKSTNSINMKDDSIRSQKGDSNFRGRLNKSNPNF